MKEISLEKRKQFAQLDNVWTDHGTAPIYKAEDIQLVCLENQKNWTFSDTSAFLV